MERVQTPLQSAPPTTPPAADARPSTPGGHDGDGDVSMAPSPRHENEQKTRDPAPPAPAQEEEEEEDGLDQFIDEEGDEEGAARVKAAREESSSEDDDDGDTKMEHVEHSVESPKHEEEESDIEGLTFADLSHMTEEEDSFHQHGSLLADPTIGLLPYKPERDLFYEQTRIDISARIKYLERVQARLAELSTDLAKEVWKRIGDMKGDRPLMSQQLSGFDLRQLSSLVAERKRPQPNDIDWSDTYVTPLLYVAKGAESWSGHHRECTAALKRLKQMLAEATAIGTECARASAPQGFDQKELKADVRTNLSHVRIVTEKKIDAACDAFVAALQEPPQDMAGDLVDDVLVTITSLHTLAEVVHYLRFGIHAAYRHSMTVLGFALKLVTPVVMPAKMPTGLGLDASVTFSKDRPETVLQIATRARPQPDGKERARLEELFEQKISDGTSVFHSVITEDMDGKCVTAILVAYCDRLGEAWQFPTVETPRPNMGYHALMTRRDYLKKEIAPLLSAESWMVQCESWVFPTIKRLKKKCFAPWKSVSEHALLEFISQLKRLSDCVELIAKCQTIGVLQNEKLRTTALNWFDELRNQLIHPEYVTLCRETPTTAEFEQLVTPPPALETAYKKAERLQDFNDDAAFKAANKVYAEKKTTAAEQAARLASHERVAARAAWAAAAKPKSASLARAAAAAVAAVDKVADTIHRSRWLDAGYSPEEEAKDVGEHRTALLEYTSRWQRDAAQAFAESRRARENYAVASRHDSEVSEYDHFVHSALREWRAEAIASRSNKRASSEDSSQGARKRRRIIEEEHDDPNGGGGGGGGGT